ncbi:hypothetical protein [uncultured Paraglaciecola sp.]|uniref:hypothetical protein n=1 Tax=uncultured Paraglaciecola sp. TaxID=1765024 RepID=UPI002611C5F8|nr:hypothetical protein [uncultured Paraglaciecola sp.]
MAFVLAKKRIVNEWPVAIEIATRGGDTATLHCSADFEIIPQDEYNKLMNNDIELLSRVVVGFGADIQHEDGSPIPCNTEGKKALFGSGGDVRKGFLNAYYSANSGIVEKNLKGSRASSQPARKSRKKK